MREAGAQSEEHEPEGGERDAHGGAGAEGTRGGRDGLRRAAKFGSQVSSIRSNSVSVMKHRRVSDGLQSGEILRARSCTSVGPGNCYVNSEKLSCGGSFCVGV